MKRISTLASMVAVFAFASAARAQVIGLSLTPSGDKEVVVVKFRAPADADYSVYEAKIPAHSAEECMASTDFTNAIPAANSVGVYDPTTAIWYLKNSHSAGSLESCTVTIMRSPVEANDLILRRSRFGTTSRSTDGVGLKESGNRTAQRSMVTSITVTFD